MCGLCTGPLKPGSHCVNLGHLMEEVYFGLLVKLLCIEMYG